MCSINFVMTSEYYELLEDDLKKRYKEKLQYEEFEFPDPLDENMRNFVFKSSKMPNITVFDIYTYLVVKHNVHSKAAFNEYTSLPSYNYVSSGKVSNLKCLEASGVSVVVASVEASQTSSKIHLPWIVARNDGEILSGHCTCMAGLGETCSHVGAILFFIEKTIADDIKKPACTSEPCKWSKTSSSVEPAPVAKINFSKPKMKEPRKTQPKTEVLPVASDDHFQMFLQNVKTSLPTSAILSLISESDDVDTDSAEEMEIEEVTLFPTFAEQVQTFLLQLPAEIPMNDKKSSFEAEFLFSDGDVAFVEETTKQMPQKWENERQGRITASNFGRIYRCKTAQLSILHDIMGYDSAASCQAIAWGKKMEKVARGRFFDIISPYHVNLAIRDTGLFVAKNEPYLGASPDGLVTCDCCVDHVLEIKCPFSLKDQFLSERKQNFFLDENLVLKDTHNYYDQVQGQMAITGASKCYFVTFTNKELHHQVIEFDELRWEVAKDTLMTFFFATVFPEIASGDALKAIEAAAEECLCKYRKNGATITCLGCRRTYHKSCVKLRKKISGWTCNACTAQPDVIF